MDLKRTLFDAKGNLTPANGIPLNGDMHASFDAGDFILDEVGGSDSFTYMKLTLLDEATKWPLRVTDLPRHPSEPPPDVLRSLSSGDVFIFQPGLSTVPPPSRILVAARAAIQRMWVILDRRWFDPGAAQTSKQPGNSAIGTGFPGPVTVINSVVPGLNQGASSASGQDERPTGLKDGVWSHLQALNMVPTDEEICGESVEESGEARPGGPQNGLNC